MLGALTITGRKNLTAKVSLSERVGNAFADFKAAFASFRAAFTQPAFATVA